MKRRAERAAARPADGADGTAGDEDIAIVGTAGRFAGAADLARFRAAVLGTGSLLGPLPESRFRWPAEGGTTIRQPVGGYLADIDRFDAGLFGIGEREAARLDPQLRLLLETARAAMEDAGHAPGSLAGTRVGVFAATTFQEWAHRLREPDRLARLRLTDIAPGIMAARLSRVFDLRGPSEMLNAACAGGLLAVHRAAQAIRAGECEVALAGAVSLILSAEGFATETRAGMLTRGDTSPVLGTDGTGFLRGEGVGVLVLKRVSQALADRDRIRAVIRGSAAAHAGREGVFSADEARRQGAAVCQALRAARADPATIGHVELQGAGHAADDLAELAVIAAGFRQAGRPDAPLPGASVGALKPVTGHMEAASGLGQVIKAVALLDAGRAPPLAGTAVPHPAIAALWPGLRFEAGPWSVKGRSRRALVSGFGFGGTHVHMVLEAAPAVTRPQDAVADSVPRAFLLSAPTEDQLVAGAASLASVLRASPAISIDDVAFTLLVGRDGLVERLAILATDLAELADGLEAFAADPRATGPWLRGRAAVAVPRLGEDDADRAWLAALVADGRWARLARLWAGGLDLDWASIADRLPGARVPLPPTAPARTRFWLDEGAPAATRAVERPPPADDRLDHLRRLVADTLGQAELPAGDDAPAILGIDSLAAMELRSRIGEATGAPPPLAAILAAPSLRALAEQLPPVPPPTEPPAAVADREARHAPFPVTDIQLAYLIGRQEFRSHGGFGCQVYWEFARDRYEPARLAAALDRLVRRHDALRTVFAADATQRILPADAVEAVAVPLFDLSTLPAPEAAQRRRELADRFLSDGFDPAGFPLFRFAVSRHGDGDRLHVAVDLLLADGPSLFLLLDELAQLDAAPDAPLPPVAYGFRDYVLEAKRREGGPGMAAAAAYWEDRLDRLPDAPALPILPGAPAAVAFRRLTGHLPPDAWRRFQDMAGSHGLTPTAALLAAFADSLAAWTERPEFCLNVTLANRRPFHPDVFRLVGDFTGNILLAVPDRSDRAFADHARAIAGQLAADAEHAEFSAVKVLGRLAARRRQAVAMPVVFTALLGYAGLLKRPVGVEAIGRFVGGATRTPQVWLDAQAMETADGLVLSWDVLDGMFAPDLLADLFQGFLARMRELASGPAAWGHPGVRIAVEAANRTTSRLPREPIFAGLLRQAVEGPDRPAVIAPDRRLTFGELAAEARSVAAHLLRAGVRPGEPVAVVLAKGWRQVVAALGIGMAGCAYVPIELPVPAARVADILTRAAARHVIADAPDPAWPAEVHPIGAVLDGAAAEPLPVVGPDDLAYVIYTSGSTGAPKGVAMAHGAVANTLHDVNRTFSIGPDDRVLGVSSLGFDLSVWDIFGVLGAGGALVLPAPESLRDPAYLAALAARERVTLWNSTPAYLQLVMEAPGVALPPSLRLVMLSGDWIPLALARRLRAERPDVALWSLGGATEAAIWSIWHRVDRVEEGWSSIPYGRPMANQRFHVLDEELRPCAPGETGQLHIGGSGLAIGYWRDGERTAAAFFRHPVTGERLYRTGDFGRRQADGTIEFLGRRDQQVKIGGHRIELAEVEAALDRIAGVHEAAALVAEDAAGNRRLAAAYRGTASVAGIRTALSARLPSYMVPALLMAVDRLPLTANGKLDRQALGLEAARRLAGQPEPAPAPGPPPPPAAADPLAAMLAAPGMLRDKAARAAFQGGAHGARKDLADRPAVALALEAAAPAPAGRRSVRSFAARPVELATLALLLSALADTGSADGPRRRYASAGSTYAVQTYLLVAEPGAPGLAAGLWHYAPATHRLHHLGPSPVAPGSLHIPANRAMGESAPVTLLLVGDLGAIRPLYGPLSGDLMRVEAGSIAQLLDDGAAALGLGLCAVGWLDMASIGPALGLTADHLLLHALVVGWPAAAAQPVAAPLPAASADPDRVALVRDAWAAVLGHGEFPDDASFFEVGGNSFMAVSLQAYLAARVQPAPSVTDLFRHPTVLALARHLEAGPPPVADAPKEMPAAPGIDPGAARRARRLAARLNGTGRQHSAGASE